MSRCLNHNKVLIIRLKVKQIQLHFLSYAMSVLKNGIKYKTFLSK